MSSLLRVMQSSIGAKLVMAVTGIGLVLFLIAHMLGNLQVFASQDAINAYGVFLRELHGLLWVARVGLLVLVGLHVVAAIRVTRLNRAARPERYAKVKTQEASYAARTLMVSGILIASYVVYHILHFTTRSVNNQHSHLVDAEQRHDIFSMVVGSFQNPLISIVYIVAMILLGMHLSHGIGSFLQTLGLVHPRYRNGLQLLGPVTAIILVLGFISVPIAVLMGALQLPSGGH